MVTKSFSKMVEYFGGSIFIDTNYDNANNVIILYQSGQGEWVNYILTEDTITLLVKFNPGELRVAKVKYLITDEGETKEAVYTITLKKYQITTTTQAPLYKEFEEMHVTSGDYTLKLDNVTNQTIKCYYYSTNTWTEHQALEPTTEIPIPGTLTWYKLTNTNSLAIPPVKTWKVEFTKGSEEVVRTIIIYQNGELTTSPV